MRQILLRALVLVGSLATAGTTTETSAETGTPPSRAALESRIEEYYGALQEKDFLRAWTFFDKTMKRDNPRDQYIKFVANSFASIKVVGRPEIWIEEMPGAGAKKVQGKAQARLMVKDRDGSTLAPLVHYTTWVFQRPASQQDPQWFLIGGPMRTDTEGKGVAPPRE